MKLKQYIQIRTALGSRFGNSREINLVFLEMIEEELSNDFLDTDYANICNVRAVKVLLEGHKDVRYRLEVQLVKGDSWCAFSEYRCIRSFLLLEALRSRLIEEVT